MATGSGNVLVSQEQLDELGTAITLAEGDETSLQSALTQTTTDLGKVLTDYANAVNGGATAQDLTPFFVRLTAIHQSQVSVLGSVQADDTEETAADASIPASTSAPAPTSDTTETAATETAAPAATETVAKAPAVEAVHSDEEKSSDEAKA